MSTTEAARMADILKRQRAAFTAALPEQMSVRRDRIDRAIAMLIDHKDHFAKAVSADFGHRSTQQTLMTDIMPSVGALSASIARASDMRVFHLEDIGPHYARTLHEWRRNLLANLPAVRALGYDDAFIRMWEFYFCYCEGGFAERVVGDVQMLLVKPGNRRPAIATADISAVR